MEKNKQTIFEKFTEYDEPMPLLTFDNFPKIMIWVYFTFTKSIYQAITPKKIQDARKDNKE